MPDGAKVGDVYLEGHLDLDDRQMAAFNRAMTNSLRKHLPSLSKDIKSELAKANLFGDIDLEADVKRNRRSTINAGRAFGQLLALGASAGIRDNARLLRDAMVLGMAGALGTITVALSAAVQAAFAVGPAAFGGLVTGMTALAGAAGVLAVAVSGISKAIGAAFKETDPEKFEKAIEGLSQNLKDLAREVQKNVPLFKQFRDVLQGAFLGGDAKAWVQPILNFMKAVQPEAAGVAKRFGEIGRALLDMADSPEILLSFKQVFAGIDAFLDTIKPSIVRLFASIFSFAGDGMAMAESAALGLNRILDRISLWFETHSLQQLFERARPALEDINRIVSAIWGTLKTLFGGEGATSGGGPLDLLADIAEALERGSVHIKNFIDWVSRLPEPVKQLLEAIAILGLLSLPLSSLIGSLTGVIQTVIGLGSALSALGLATGPVIAIIAGAAAIILGLAGIFVIAWTRSEEFREKIKGLGEGIKRMWEEAVQPALAEFRVAFEELITSGEQLLAEFGLDWGDLGTAIFGAVLAIISYIALFITVVTEMVRWISDRLAELAAAIDAVKQIWDTSFAAMKQFGDAFAGWLTSSLLPAFLNLLTNATTIFNGIRDAFGRAFNEMVELARKPISLIVGFINDPLLKGYNIVAKAIGLPEIGPIPIPFADGGIVSRINPNAQLDYSQVEDLRSGATGGSAGSGGARGFAGALRFASGGIAPGTGNRDTVPALLTPGEGILTKSEMAKLGGPTGFNQLRSMIQFFAGGGIVQTLQQAFGSGAAGLTPVAGFSQEQLGNAAEIIRVGRQMGFPQHGLLVALMTAMQESNLRNLSHLGAANDHDSVGLFQQRPSQGWGSVSELTTPAIAAAKFFSALGRVPGWQGMAPTVAAQSVQRSAFPSAYAKWLGPASQLLGGVTGGIFDFFTDPIGKFTSGMLGEMPALGSSPFAQILLGMGKNLVSGAAKKLFESATFGLFGSGPVSGGIGGALGSKGIGVNAIINLVKGLAGLLGVRYAVTSSFRPGDPGHHGSGRAVDFGGYNQDALAGALYRMGGSLLELIHTTNTRGYYIKNGRAISSYGIEDERHRDHIHVAMDKGGAIGPGTNVIDNFTGRPEAVLNPRHTDFVGRVLSGENLVVENTLWLQLDDGNYVQARINKSHQAVAQGLRRGRGKKS